MHFTFLFRNHVQFPLRIFVSIFNYSFCFFTLTKLYLHHCYMFKCFFSAWQEYLNILFILSFILNVKIILTHCSCFQCQHRQIFNGLGIVFQISHLIYPSNTSHSSSYGKFILKESTLMVIQALIQEESHTLLHFSLVFLLLGCILRWLFLGIFSLQVPADHSHSLYK